MQNEALLNGKTEPALPAMAERFRKLTSSRNVEKIRREIFNEFGCEVNDRYASALLTFVDEMINESKK